MCNIVLETLETQEKKPKPENSGPGQAGLHLIKIQVSQVTPEKTRKTRVGSDFGYFRDFVHSNDWCECWRFRFMKKDCNGPMALRGHPCHRSLAHDHALDYTNAMAYHHGLFHLHST